MNPETTDQTPQRQGTPADELDIRRMISELADDAAALGDLIPPDVRALVRAIADHPWSRE